MKQKLLALLVLVSLSGCMSRMEKDNVSNAAKTSRQAALKYDPATTSPASVKTFLNNNADAWEQFNQAVNGVKPATEASSATTK